MLALAVDCIRVECSASGNVDLIEKVGGHRSAYRIHLERILEEVVARGEIEVVDELDFLRAFAGGIGIIPHLCLKIISYG